MMDAYTNAVRPKSGPPDTGVNFRLTAITIIA